MIGIKKKKITILVDSLSTGGAEKSAATLSNLLYKSNYWVSIISIKDEISYNYSGDLINLGKNVSSIKLFKQYQKFKRLKTAISEQKPDYVLDYRIRNRVIVEYLLHIFIFKNYNMVFTNHNFFIDYHLPKGSYFIKAYNNNIVTAVSKDIKQELENNYNLKNVHYIPNTINNENVQELAEKKLVKDAYIIAVGRLYNAVKQFDKLIETYRNSELPNKGIKLYILGDGRDMNKLKELIIELGLTDKIILKGFVKNPYSYIKHAKFLVLCSKFEGLPMVIIEALALNTPVVSFNCKSGPSEMIVHNVNGLLVENQNFNELQKAINYLITNEAILDGMKSNTTNNFKVYTEQHHIDSWNKILI